MGGVISHSYRSTGLPMRLNSAMLLKRLGVLGIRSEVAGPD